MAKVLFILYIYVCPISVFAINAYHVEYFEQEKTWFQAQRTCNNSGGWLTSNKNNVINCNQVTKGATFWTGEYSTISHWISKIGCIELLGEPHVSLVPTVSKCLEICRMQQIDFEILGHIKNRCVCISSNILRKPLAIQQCYSSTVSNNSYWMYSVTQNKTLPGSGNCVFVDCKQEPWPVVYAAACIDERRPFCDGHDKLNWTLSQELCKDHIPGNLSEICKSLPTAKGVWLHMHRVVLRNDVKHDVYGKENDVIQCASFHCHHQKDVGAVQANNPCRNTLNGFFCTLSSEYNETTDKSYTTNNSASYYFQSTKVRGSLQTSNAFKVTGTKSFATIVNSPTVFQTTTSILEKMNEKRNITETSEDAATSDTGLIVGGVLGALSIIGVVVLVVIITLRGKAATKRQTMEPYGMSKDNSAIDEDTQRQKTSDDETANTQYEEDWAHAGRFFAEKIMETAMVNSHDRKNLNDVYAVVMKDNMTSPLQGGQDSEIASHEAIDSEYDMLNITPQFLRENTENNLYDSSLADRCESDPTYNTATDMIHSRQNNEDVYDRI